MADSEDHAGVGFPPPFVFLGFLLIGIAADRRLGWTFGIAPAVRWPLAIALLVIGGFLIAGAFVRFRRAGTDPEPWKPASALVTTGIYRLTRNPMYLGMATVTLGLALAFGGWASLAGLALAVIAIDRAVIAKEEPYLERRFGEDYRAFKARVRRWI